MKFVVVAAAGIAIASFQGRPAPVTAISVEQVMAHAYQKAVDDAKAISQGFDYRITIAEEDLDASGPKPGSRKEVNHEATGLKSQKQTIIRMQDILQPKRYRYEFDSLSLNSSPYRVKFFPIVGAPVPLLPDASFGMFSGFKNLALSQIQGTVVIDPSSYAVLSFQGGLPGPTVLHDGFFKSICEQNDIQINQVALELPDGSKAWTLHQAVITYRLTISHGPDQWGRRTIAFRDFRPKPPRR